MSVRYMFSFKASLHHNQLFKKKLYIDEKIVHRCLFMEIISDWSILYIHRSQQFRLACSMLPNISIATLQPNSLIRRQTATHSIAYLAIATPNTHPPTVDQKPIQPASTCKVEQRLFIVQHAIHDARGKRGSTKCTKCAEVCQSLCLIDSPAVSVCLHVRQLFFLHTDEG